MAQLISLSRAARLVGVKRATLQKQIREVLNWNSNILSINSGVTRTPTLPFANDA
ncbi:MAG TPA: hypothetical protein VK971_08040 [Thiohalobacter sp.]|nr:hypothetical protein [Thiohalobacter sp.]